MRKERIIASERRIAALLDKEGSLKNPEGEARIGELIEAAEANADLANAIARSGVTREQLVTFYRRSVSRLLPTPYVRYDGREILAPTYLFLECDALVSALDEIGRYLHDEREPLVDRRVKGLDQLLGLSQAAYLNLKGAGRASDRRVERSHGYSAGCLSVLIIGGALATFFYALPV